MIVTLTANPSIDRTITLLDRLERGAVQRVDQVISQGGGKGVNISRAALAAGTPTLAIFPADADDAFVLGLHRDGIPCVPVGPAGEVRTNIAVTEPDGTTTKLNSPGAQATPALLDAVADCVLERAATADWVVLAGSTPPGVHPGWYAELVAALRGTPARVAVDTSEAPLVALVEGLPGSAPDLMKPNGEELGSFTGVEAALLESDPEAAAAAAGVLLDRGVGSVLATLGALGAVLVTAHGAWHATPPPTNVVSTVGAGDSSLFGYLLGDLRGLAEPDRLALGVAYGSAAAGLPGTTIPTPAQTRPDQVVVRELALSKGS
jgi:1-phosphofructokinase